MELSQILRRIMQQPISSGVRDCRFHHVPHPQPILAEHVALPAAAGRQALGVAQIPEIASGAAHIRGEMLGLLASVSRGRLLMFKPSSLDSAFCFMQASYLQDSIAWSLDMQKICTLQDLLYQSNCISLHCTLNEQNHHLISDFTIKQMRQGAFLVNAACGRQVEEKASA
ncbi:C-terminal-binding protein 2-like [Choloepus didactylus]|uniref:C-terminal-binding protein 2-like n=1 Tax=Choloepus didactylus TaxID=27675 RepID=UPI00189D2B13|nr:C-terminal-binding protein 2-like [Choloepus didactylus]